MLAGMMARPRATSSRTASGEIFSRSATYCISSVMMPLRAKCICEKFLAPPFIAAERFSIHVSLSAISPHSKKSAGGHARRNAASLSHPDSHPATRVRVQTARDFCARSKRRCRAFSSVAHLLTEAQRVYRGGAEESDEMHGTEIFARGNSACRDSKRGLRASRHLALRPWKNHHPDGNGHRLRLGQSSLSGLH